MPLNDTEITPEELQKFALGVCQDNVPAAQFVMLWFHYCHEIDDLIDTMVDGRPTLSKQLIIRIFIRAAEVYNNEWYRAHYAALCPIAILVTSAYATSVAWENDPLEHRRKMGDHLRCCGNDMLFAVAAICGGYEHLRKIEVEVRERSWKAHHDEQGNYI